MTTTNSTNTAITITTVAVTIATFAVLFSTGFTPVNLMYVHMFRCQSIANFNSYSWGHKLVVWHVTSSAALWVLLIICCCVI